MKSLTVVGQPAPSPTSTFTDAAGKTHTLAEFKGKVVVLNIWATWCAPCVAEMPTLAKLASDTAGQPIAILPISVDRDEDKANAESFIAKRPPLPFYADPTYAIVYAFKPPVAEAVPTTVLIDADRPGPRRELARRRRLVRPRRAQGDRGAGKGVVDRPRRESLAQPAFRVDHWRFRAHFLAAIRALGLLTTTPREVVSKRGKLRRNRRSRFPDVR